MMPYAVQFFNLSALCEALDEPLCFYWEQDGQFIELDTDEEIIDMWKKDEQLYCL